eukprot:SAG31_NODE_45801_length_257_cov_0.658228_1_plen_39_part_01
MSPASPLGIGIAQCPEGLQGALVGYATAYAVLVGQGAKV